MASLAASAVTLVTGWSEGNPNGRLFKHYLLQINCTTNGSETNPIPAAALGLTLIYGSTNGVGKTTGAVYPCYPDFLQANLLVGGGASNAPQDINEVLQIEVWGI